MFRFSPLARYLGVVVEPGKYDVSQQVSSSSAVAFEWGLGCATGSCTEVVTPLCKDVVRRGVPAPQFVGNVQGGQIDAAELRRVASEAGTDDKSVYISSYKELNPSKSPFRIDPSPGNADGV